jgi:two-component system nitrate/nitrite response regulator NarL
MARVLLADRRRLFNEALGALFASDGDHDVVGWRSSREAVLTAVAQLRPDLVLIEDELALPGKPSLIEHMLARHPGIKVLVLAPEMNVGLIVDAVRDGAMGVISKSSGAHTVLRAVKAALAGEGIVPRAMLPHIFRLLSDVRHQAAKSPLNRLSPREREVLVLLSQGWGNASIGDALSISPHTVRTHIQNILEKLEMHSKLEVATFAMQRAGELANT